MEQLASLLPLIVLMGLFYLLILRPARARQREAMALQQSLQQGQEVMTTSGLYGRIVELSDDDVVLEVAPEVRTRWARAAVAQVVPADETPGEDMTDESSLGERLDDRAPTPSRAG